ncbi:MAG: efflux transporter outer membrane subunit [Candidatus Liberibacter ctenarytainae]|uniref:Efflux transporter outer membrane subunit n=1 Tax=Candidatus Liberibacter ctenarytainae TaxID=2020335 RepID=A0A937AFC9_9HYPH|nr:efflux transporter outer membrane subunit [Candidatus Liberibacter ctenarytainae]
MVFLRINFSILAILLSGCAAIGPEYIQPKMPQLPRHFSIGKSDRKITIDTFKWWESFNDKLLNKLVSIAFKQNLSICQATERINAARENIIATKGNLVPSLHTSISSAIMPESHKNSIAKSDCNWTLGLFGQNHRAIESALAQFDGVYAESDMAKMTMVSELIPAYIDARYFQERMYIAHKILSLYKKTLDLTEIKFSEGVISKLDLMKLQAEIHSIESEIPNLEKGFRISVHNISTILGHPPTALLTLMQKQPNSFRPNLYMNIHIGIPADLIRNRPDIRYHEKKLADCVAKIGIAKADLYPSISLSGSIALTHNNRLSPTYNHNWSFGPTLYFPIFNGGKIKANIRIAETRAREQYIAWQKTVLHAIKEVENALISINEDKKIVSSLRNQVESYQKTLSFVMIGYQEGMTPLSNVLDIERTIAQADFNLTIAQQQLVKSYVNLYIAVGSGYNSFNQ